MGLGGGGAWTGKRSRSDLSTISLCPASRSRYQLTEPVRSLYSAIRYDPALKTWMRSAVVRLNWNPARVVSCFCIYFYDRNRGKLH